MHFFNFRLLFCGSVFLITQYLTFGAVEKYSYKDVELLISLVDLHILIKIYIVLCHTILNYCVVIGIIIPCIYSLYNVFFPLSLWEERSL